MNDSPEHERWLDADTAERILNGQDITQADHRTTDLARLLAAADGTAAGRPEDERAALHAFAQQQAAAGRTVRSPFRPTVRESRTAKVVIGGVAAVFALGGVAIAAQTGTLPHPFHSGPLGPKPAPATATATATRTGTAVTGPPGARNSRPTAADTTKPSAPLPPTPVSHPGHTTGAPEVPGAKGLCESYLKAAQGGARLDSPSMARLEEAAGSAGEVDAYCVGLTGHPAAHTPSPHPTHPATPDTSHRK